MAIDEDRQMEDTSMFANDHSTGPESDYDYRDFTLGAVDVKVSLIVIGIFLVLAIVS